MNEQIMLVSALIVLASFVVFCGIKLFTMGSDLATIIHKYGLGLGLLFLLAAVFAFLLPNATTVLGWPLTILLVVLICTGLILIEHELSICRHYLLSAACLDNSHVKHVKGAKRHRSPRLAALIGLNLFGIFGGILDGIAIGASFLPGIGSGMVALSAMALLVILQKVACIQDVENKLSEKQVVFYIALSLIVTPVTAIVTYIFTRSQYAYASVYEAIAASYFIYLTIWNFYFIVKNRKKH